MSESNTPPAAPAVVVEQPTPPVPPNKPDSPAVLPPVELTAEQQELQRLRQENAELKQQQLERERDQLIKAAVAVAKTPDVGPSIGEQAIRRDRAIKQSGGVAFWYKIPIADRVAILTDGKRVPAASEVIGKYFGPQSSATAAMQLKVSNPMAYRSYRAEAVELGLIG